jgi:type VI secretion system protein VasJ
MELAEYRQCITTPIPGDSPVGGRLIDDSLFDFVEDQMMKVGSLSHSSVQWDEVEHRVLTLIRDKSKDIKLLVYLLQCLHNDPTTARFMLSLQLLNDFVGLFWEDSFPAPGPRGKLPRRKFFSQIVQRFSLALDKQDFNRYSAENSEKLLETLAEFETVVEKQELSNDACLAFTRNLKTKLSLAKERQNLDQPADVSSPSTQSSRSSEESSSTSTSSSAPVAPPITVDSSSDKATRQTLLKVADFLAEDEHAIALAIRVRRHAVWASITSVPDHNQQGETLLRPMQQDRVKDYKDMMRNPDLALWRKVEQSLTMAPYWFEGQLMSYTVAQALDKKQWCRAIKEEAKAFIERMPTLLTLQFKGGQPFVTPEVQEWLDEPDQSAGSLVAASGWQEIRQDAFGKAKEAGIAAALAMLNDGMANAVEPRDQFYWRLISADLLHENGLTAMAVEQYQTLQREALSMSVPDWEPSLFQQLEKQTTSE